MTHKRCLKLTKRQKQILQKVFEFSPGNERGFRYPIWQVRVLRLTETGWDIAEKLQRRGYLTDYFQMTPKGLTALRCHN
jgi:hypothetical protein